MELYSDRTSQKAEDRQTIVDDDYVAHNFDNYNDSPPPRYELPSQPQQSSQPSIVEQPPPHQPCAPYIVTSRSPVVTEYVESYMTWSIINCLCCCWILGIIAIAMSCTARDEYLRGNVEGAKRNSQAALGLNVAGTIFGFIAIIVVVVLNVAILH